MKIKSGFRDIAVGTGVPVLLEIPQAVSGQRMLEPKVGFLSGNYPCA